MSQPETTPPKEESLHDVKNGVRSLRDLIDRVTGRNIALPTIQEDAGIAESLPYPFLAIVGQREMKLALILALINPAVGGVLLIGPRGTGKTTAVRGLVDLLPQIPRSLCFYGCRVEDIETGGLDAVCPDCARKFGQGEPLERLDRVRLIELPLNAQLEDVIGGLDERAALHERMRIHRGLLAQADRNLLYIDEVNLLADDVIDALLDASAQGRYTIRRGAIAASYWSRFVLIGSMNPEEGRLRPQIQDRFGLRVIVQGLKKPEERLEAYRRVHAFLHNRRQVIAQFASETNIAQAEIQSARMLLPEIIINNDIARLGLRIIEQMGIDSLRAEITLFEAARAYTAADGRTDVRPQDLLAVAPIALRLRRSTFFGQFFEKLNDEAAEIGELLDSVIKGTQANS